MTLESTMPGGPNPTAEEDERMAAQKRIGSFRIFKGLSDREIEQVSRFCEEVDLREGHRVFSEGEPAEYFFILLEGSVDLRFELPYRQTSKEMTVVTLNPGDCFGWSAIVRPHKAALSCYSTENSKAFRIRGADLLELCERNNHMGLILMQNVAAIVAERLTKQQEQFIKEAGDSLRFQW